MQEQYKVKFITLRFPQAHCYKHINRIVIRQKEMRNETLYNATGNSGKHLHAIVNDKAAGLMIGKELRKQREIKT